MLHHVEDTSGRQRWILEKGDGDWYYKHRARSFVGAVTRQQVSHDRFFTGAVTGQQVKRDRSFTGTVAEKQVKEGA